MLGKALAQGYGTCGRHREVADAEAIAAEVALPQSEGMNMCMDNLGVAKRISKRMREPGTSQLETDETRRILARWEGLELDKPTGRIYWAPENCEIPRSEIVDQPAKAGCKSADLLVPDRTMSLAATRRWKNDAFRANFKNWMRDNRPNTDHLGGTLGLPKPFKANWVKRAEPRLRRWDLGSALQTWRLRAVPLQVQSSRRRDKVPSAELWQTEGL
ncbi:putative double-stranded RNA/RNA-DNA hybrid binding protein [Ceratocystis lukuohia]|uniref:Double-stranded RNA/RNA-DNA hybrid binding protein n=1 Tax=Ceratocystis lukuohia TaxID=2019550 RepID=A0ABR4MIE8_9PEZI